MKKWMVVQRLPESQRGVIVETDDPSTLLVEVRRLLVTHPEYNPTEPDWAAFEVYNSVIDRAYGLQEVNLLVAMLGGVK